MAAKERAAGGVVGRGGKVLLVQVTNLQGEVRWTFPKGHLEGKEKPLEAALREVEEETGWRCRSMGFLAEIRYRFNRNGRPVAKTVRWYRMTPVEKVGRPDAVEIMKTKWVAARSAAKSLSYPTDLKLIALYLRK
ncbi:MAG: NUDIX domain-containing protein [Elusimicrobiota bacterium]|nr:NUDIX domain-containing protein [Elusimicrobiota bacterium]